jgi:hypothetical protein
MTELSKGRSKVKPGQKVRGVICVNCRKGIALSRNVSRLPETFLLTCPRCRDQTTYRKTEIQILEAHSLQ